MNDIRQYRAYPSDLDLRLSLGLVWEYFHDCHYKEDWDTCPAATITFTANVNRTFTLRSLKELDRLLQQHPHPERIFLHTHWNVRGEVIRFMVTVQPSSLIVSV